MFTFIRRLFCWHTFKEVYIGCEERQNKFYLHSECVKCGYEKRFEKNKYPPTMGLRG